MASDLCFLELFFPLPASRITHKSIKYSILKSTDTAPPPLHPLSPLPKVVCEILRLIEEKECDPVAPSCREGCYKCVCVFDRREQVIVCTPSTGLRFPEVSSLIFQPNSVFL